MASERSKRPPISANPPPRTLNIQKFAESRAPELESLHSVVANRLNNDYRSRRNKRRRTTGHDNRISKNRLKKRRKLSQVDKDGGGGSISENDKENITVPPRRIRRRMEFKMNPVSGFVSSGDGTKRLRTHRWLAKRFTMVKRWGFYLPLGLQGRGRGSRAVLKWYKHGALIHDASYDCAVQLEGPEDSLLAILRMVMVLPPIVSGVEVSQSVHCGVCYGGAMLHHVGDPVSRLITPVTYMWRPFCKDQIDIDVERDSLADGDSMCEKNECIPLRQLWIWMHAAAFEEGFDALRFASQKQTYNDGACINVLSLEGKLAKLEVMGSKATHILQKMLYAMSSTSTDSELRKYSVMKPCTNSKLQKSFVLEHAEHLPPHAILSLTVHDPRDLPVKQTEYVPELPFTSPEGDLPNEDCKSHASLAFEAPNKNEEAVSSLWLKPAMNSVFLSDSKDLWDFHGVMNPPMEENLLCIEKHNRRLSSFYLDNKNSAALSSETKEGSSRSCPILLLKNTNQSGSCMGWSIILPLSWVKPFWISLVSSGGAHVIGLRERRWIAGNAGLPSFPFDFPDCKAFSCFMDAEASASDHAAGLRPPAMRPLKVPIPPPWNCVRLTVQGELLKVGDHQTLDVRKSNEVVPSSSIIDSDPKYCEAETLKQDDASFLGFIARTSNSLNDFLNEINGGHLLIFPKMAMGKKAFSDLMVRGRLSWEPKGMKHIPVDRKRCFLRVVLHAYKKGVFEEGAVVCAPILTDLSLWASRSEEQEGLQIPPSLLKSYFILQPSGKWELQVPENPTTRQFHRWPIGFVTSGFVRGSAKPAAEAICEGTLLAQLREEQWREMQEKGRPEILVLVRNLRSTSYRLALATIVLEQHEDVEFMYPFSLITPCIARIYARFTNSAVLSSSLLALCQE